TGCPCDLVVVGDSTGALTAAALDSVSEQPGARVWSWNASRSETTALAGRFAGAAATGRLVLAAGEDPAPLEEFAAGADAHLVLARLPKSLAGLEDLARRLARLAAGTGREDLTLVAGGRVKHMTRSQNEVLAGSFTEVRASRGLGKSRALIASAPRPDAAAPGPAAGVVTVRGRGLGRELTRRRRGGVLGGCRDGAGARAGARARAARQRRRLRRGPGRCRQSSAAGRAGCRAGRRRGPGAASRRPGQRERPAHRSPRRGAARGAGAGQRRRRRRGRLHPRHPRGLGPGPGRRARDLGRVPVAGGRRQR